jgi:hypothetical protein
MSATLEARRRRLERIHTMPNIKVDIPSGCLNITEEQDKKINKKEDQERARKKEKQQETEKKFPPKISDHNGEVVRPKDIQYDKSKPHKPPARDKAKPVAKTLTKCHSVDLIPPKILKVEPLVVQHGELPPRNSSVSANRGMSEMPEVILSRDDQLPVPNIHDLYTHSFIGVNTLDTFVERHITSPIMEEDENSSFGGYVV